MLVTVTTHTIRIEAVSEFGILSTGYGSSILIESSLIFCGVYAEVKECPHSVPILGSWYYNLFGME